VGIGDPLEAPYTLSGPLPAGSWHLVGDGAILQPVDMQFDVVWRDAAGEHPIVTFTHHFDPPAGSDAVPLDADATGAAVPAKAGDQLVLRMSTNGPAPGPAYVPNADGSHTHGRIPSITHP
jgi:hypothetical protein